VEPKGGIDRMWTKPEYTEMRFGFEVTMYIATR
jgi:coenzyme PQQ precursor peptide PqqA